MVISSWWCGFWVPRGTRRRLGWCPAVSYLDSTSCQCLLGPQLTRDAASERGITAGFLAFATRSPSHQVLTPGGCLSVIPLDSNLVQLLFRPSGRSLLRRRRPDSPTVLSLLTHVGSQGL